MATETSETPKKAAVSERDQYWLDHEAAQAASGQTAKEYAAAQDLSLHALYQARKRLRAVGLLAPARGKKKSRRKPVESPAVSFSKIAVTPAASEPRFRLELPSGVALEWPGGDVPESVAGLLERLAQRA